MLLSYSFDTVESTIEDGKAIGLRKVFAGRRIQEARATGVLDDKTLIALKEESRSQLEEHSRSEVAPYIRAKVSDKIIMTRTDHQLQIEGYLRKIEKDVARATRLSKSHIDSLTDLEKRIQTMRHQLKAPGSLPSVEEEVRLQTKFNSSVKLDTMFVHCYSCNRRIVSQLYKKHNEICLQKSAAETLKGPLNSNKAQLSDDQIAWGAGDDKPIYDYEQDLLTTLTTFKAQPPRFFKFVSKGCSFISLAWEPPVIDGGLAITDYEIKYSYLYSEINPETDKYVKFHGDIPAMKTSNWCLNNPICHSGYKIVSLRAGTDYFDIMIRAINLRGCSEWVPLLENENSSNIMHIKTEEPDAPEEPLFFQHTGVTSSCIYLKWDSPFYDGGSPIVDYIITYTAMEIHMLVTERDAVIPRVMSFNTGSNDTSGAIRNIMPDIDVVKINIKAINKAGLVGPATDLGVELHTGDCSRYARILRELSRAYSWSLDYIDSSFITNVNQRYVKADYIRILEEERLKSKPDALEEKEFKEWAAVKASVEQKKAAAAALQAAKASRDSLFDRGDFNDDDGEEDKTMENFAFTFHQRRDHYKRRVKILEKKIIALGEERREIDSQRTRLTSIMKSKQRRQLELKLERERIEDFRGDLVTSAAIHGHNMQYSVAEFNSEVFKAAQKCLQDIAEAKYKVMAGEKRKAAIKLELVTANDFLKERRAAFLNFSMEHKKAVQFMDRFHNRGDDLEKDTRLLRYYFKELKEFMDGRKAVRLQAKNCFEKVLYRYKRSAFAKWRFGHFHRSSSEKDEFTSVGSLMLQKSLEKRQELQSDLRMILASTKNINTKLSTTAMPIDARNKLMASKDIKGMDEGKDHEKIGASRKMEYLYEGDGYAMIGLFDMGRSMYESQIMFLRSQPNLDIKNLAICHGRLGKMFLKQGKHDRAIVEFDRQLSLAREIEDNVEAAEAYYGVGEGYLRVRDYKNAIRYLDIAQVRLFSISHIPKYCGALRALRECYARLNLPDKIAYYNEKISLHEDELRNKMTDAISNLDKMKNRLVMTTAGILDVVKIERTTMKALELRHYIEKKSDEQAALDAKLEKQTDRCQEIEQILSDIQQELKEAYETDELEMLSHLVHDQAQVIDVEELKTRLNERKIKELELFKVAKADEHRIEIAIKTIEDELTDADMQLDIENGALMTHIRHDKPFRCISISPANAAGNEVTGTATGGVEQFVAAEGSNVHVIDFHSGELLHVFLGDDRNNIMEKRGHTGVITCLLHDGDYIFSGSADENIICWNGQIKLQKDSKSNGKLRVMSGHEGTISSLAADGKFLMSGSADTTLRLWNKHTGAMLRVIYGHSKSVLSIEMGPTWMITGSADEEVRLWSISKAKIETAAPKVECTKRLVGHDVSVTCVRYGALEVMSGDVLGRIFIWWAETGEILRECKVHDGPIKSMQFDAIHIVSGGTDNVCAITDIATGEPLQALRGHEGHVLTVAFDTEKIISIGGDNTLRYWQWGKKMAPQDKYHVLNRGQTLVDVSKLFETTVSELMKWNGILEPRHCYEGMKLIAFKGDPSVPTLAEKISIERERRKEAGMSMTSKRFQSTSGSGDTGYKTPKNNRVYKLVTDMDYHSMSNRMFRQDKMKNDLFPEKSSSDRNEYSLSVRMQQNFTLAKNIKMTGRPRYFLSRDNEDEWGDISDSIAISMLSLFVEFEGYDIVIAMKKELRDTKSVLGRIFVYEHQKKNEGQHMLTIEDVSKDPNDDLEKATSTMGKSHQLENEPGLEAMYHDSIVDSIMATISEEEEEANIIH